MPARARPSLRDPQRLEALHSTGLLDTPAEDEFDRLTRLAAQTFHAPLSAITLVDDQRQFFKSAVGLPEPFRTTREVPLPYSFCKYVVGSGRPLIVKDARAHRWLRKSPAIAELGMVAYAGVPLRTASGHTLGSFFLSDSVPRLWIADERRALEDFARIAEDHIALHTRWRPGSPAHDRSAAARIAIEELFSTTARFGALIEQSTVGMGIAQDGRIRYANPMFARMFGYTEEEALALPSVLALVVEEDRAMVSEDLRKRLDTGVQSMRYEFRGCRKDGGIVHIEVHGSRAQVDGAAAVVGILLDVSERAQAEAALRSSEMRTRRLLDLAHDAFVAIDEDGTITDWNVQAERTFGWSREEAIGAALADTILPEKYRQAHKQGIEHFLSTGQGAFLDRRVEMVARRRDGDTIPVELTITPIKLGDSYAFSSFLHDISARKRTEEELRQSEERYRRLFDDDLTGNVITTPAGQIVACNPTFVRIFGYGSVQEVLGTHATRFFASVEAWETWLERVRTNGRLELQESELFRKDGQTVQVREKAIGIYDKAGALTEIRRYLFDITKRKQAEEALRRSEERFRTIIENAGDIVHILDEQGVIRYISPSVEKVLGYRPEEMVGRFGREFIHPDDAPRTDEGFEEAIQHPGAERFLELRLRHRDGSWRTVEVRGKVLDDRTGTRIAIVNTHDITERMQVQEALSRSEERFRLVARATNDVLWEWDIASGDLHWSEAAPKVFRFAVAEVGSSIEWWVERVHPEDRERVLSDLHHVVHGASEVWSSEYRFLRGDGVYATILDRGYVVREENGGPSRVIGSMMDITERKRSEEIHRLLARVSALLERSLDPGITLPTVVRALIPVFADYCVIDLLEGEHLRRAAAAHAVAAQEALLESGEPQPLKAAAEGDLIAKVVRDHEPILVPDATADFLESSAPNPEHRKRFELLGAHSLMIIPFVMREEVLGIITLATAESGRHYSPLDLVVAEDLGRRIALALENARLYGRAQQAVRDREQVLGVVSHDLRNPLNTIKLSADLLRNVNEERRSGNLQWLDMIGRSADQMERMIEDLLDLSSIDAGGFTVNPADHEVASLLSEVCESFQPLAEQEAITLRCDPGTGPATAWVDSHRICRVFSNLLGNALKFTPEGGAITLRAEYPAQEIRFSVSDNGPGIPAEHLSHVFDRYWQARKGDRRGAGLGLSIARGIVEAHGGRIWVESTPGEGTTFFFTVASTPGGADPARKWVQ